LTAKSAYLTASKELDWAKPAAEGSVKYRYDPAKPTPYVADWETSRRAPVDWLARNQKFLEGRADTATFRMEPIFGSPRPEPTPTSWSR
jgi:hypothetical protein